MAIAPIIATTTTAAVTPAIMRPILERGSSDDVTAVLVPDTSVVGVLVIPLPGLSRLVLLLPGPVIEGPTIMVVINIG